MVGRACGCGAWINPGVEQCPNPACGRLYGARLGEAVFQYFNSVRTANGRYTVLRHHGFKTRPKDKGKPGSLRERVVACLRMAPQPLTAREIAEVEEYAGNMGELWTVINSLVEFGFVEKHEVEFRKRNARYAYAWKGNKT